MSFLVVPDDGKKRLLITSMGGPSFAPVSVRLYQNDFTPVHGSTVASVTECNFGGYVARSLTGLSVASAMDASGRAVATFDPCAYTKSGGSTNNVYGYYVCDSTGAMLWCERFDGAPIPMSVDGAFIQITPKFTTASQYSNT